MLLHCEMFVLIFVVFRTFYLDNNVGGITAELLQQQHW
jgi:hypothetical protein